MFVKIKSSNVSNEVKKFITKLAFVLVKKNKISYEHMTLYLYHSYGLNLDYLHENKIDVSRDRDIKSSDELIADVDKLLAFINNELMMSCKTVIGKLIDTSINDIEDINNIINEEVFSFITEHSWIYLFSLKDISLKQYVYAIEMIKLFIYCNLERLKLHGYLLKNN